jgi:hypothetical protein
VAGLVIPEGAGQCQSWFEGGWSLFLGFSGGFGRAKARVGVKDRPEADRGAAVVLDANSAWRMLAPVEKLRAVVLWCCSMAGSPVLDLAWLRSVIPSPRGRHGVRCDSTAGGVNQRGRPRRRWGS